jgi:hypothetical protein
MKKTFVCSFMFFLNRRKRMQEKKRLRTLKRLEQVSMMAE